MGTIRLGTVRKSFRQWRTKHGSGTGYHIPEKMRERAIALLDEHSIDEVTRELGLGTGTVSRWQRIYRTRKRRAAGCKRETRPEFVEVKGIPASQFTAELTLEWVRQDGNRMRLSGASVSTSREFINEFLRHLLLP